MEDNFKKTLWQNFGATIDMLKGTIVLCPDELWNSKGKFFYMAYHTTIFLDYYLSIPTKEFKPVLPYTLVDVHQMPSVAIDDVLPSRLYTRDEILTYLSDIRKKCKMVIMQTDPSSFFERWIDDTEINLHGLCPSLVEHYSVLEILFYNLRHVQHHVAQLNLILRDKANVAADWVSLAEE